MKITRVWAYRVLGSSPARILKCYIYRGFRIDILDNNYKDFKFEYVVIPLSPTAKALTRRALRKYSREEQTIADPTSHRFLKVALDSARTRVNELSSPFWLKDWKY